MKEKRKYEWRKVEEKWRCQIMGCIVMVMTGLHPTHVFPHFWNSYSYTSLVTCFGLSLLIA